jgi:NADPH-dependent curcumin reductase
MKNRQWLLARRPHGAIQDSDFTFVETDAPTPGEGEVLVRNLMLSCDPTQRGWIAFDTYLPAVKIGEVVRSIGAGRVVASNTSDFAVGDIVSGLTGWQDYVAMNPKGQLNKLPLGAPLELAMSALGLTGITAYFGLLDVGRPVAGDTVVVSGAAGATGSVVGQIAKIKGCRAIGIAGGAEKCHWLTDEAGFDAAIDYKSEDVQARLKALCPAGIDIFFDNVGGDVLDAALARLAMRGRVVLCGGIANYNATDRRRDRRTTSTWSSSADAWRASSYLITWRALLRRSRLSLAGSRRESSRTRSTCNTVWRPRRRRCGGCSKVATTASSFCASRNRSWLGQWAGVDDALVRAHWTSRAGDRAFAGWLERSPFCS